jgi:5,6-dimethylbenzimidazole synthase
MQIDEFMKLVHQRRSIRRFKPDPIPDAYIQQILEAGRWAMSGANGQPWEFIVVKNRDTIKKLADLYKKTRHSFHTIDRTQLEEIRHSADTKTEGGRDPFFINAPLVIVVLGDLRVVQFSSLAAAAFNGNEVVLEGLATACQNMHLAASALELGSEWVSICTPYDSWFKDLLEVPVEYTIQMLMPVGYPANIPNPPYRRELDQIVHYEKYDMSKYRTDEEIIDSVIEHRKKMHASYPVIQK